MLLLIQKIRQHTRLGDKNHVFIIIGILGKFVQNTDFFHKFMF